MVLPLDILYDIQRYIFTYLLLLVVVMSAFSVIYFTHLNRQTTSGLEILLTERDELDIEWRNLLLEQNSLAEHSTIESKASKLLQMKRPNINSEVIIQL
ncbi:cell division protein FtsL [Colwellia sp. MB3u-28]|nr:cell division protein FtsL [Colwellia sp. MB02u-7]MBA6236338.1 cell division protein FtsL [Colwellia sp. MB02u-11]MBA6256872.1 cell division protein FtsL [Colwellia sp. MB3u-28]MBA6261122.1 cell division protein FtsL [Colwellia sp. MB3u-41]MBA6298262.1 cell division protein FtsL [Colwellia sp. MB3u-22]MBA6303999.1 cell division protein FtsL [Colwellia sp. MB02u-14]MBA6311913.1 cell division protein FtsL [Colwellia sp. MB3u-64]